jgi:hypothetical protein
MVAINENGRRIGEDHHLAKLTDHDVGLLLDLRDEGFSYGWLAAKFEISKSAVRWYCIGGRRAQTISGFRAVIIINPRKERT